MQLSAKVLLVLAACLATVGCQSPGAMASLEPAPISDGLSQSTAMPTGVAAKESPAGFASFCLRFADQCSVDPASPASLTLDAATVEKLSKVNLAVNRAIWPEDDIKHYGRPEYWTIPTDGYGDCDDYAVTKRAQLIAAGLPENALRLAVVVTPQMQRHAVLTVATDKGDYVLDSLTDRIKPWSGTGYQWVARESGQNARSWVSLQTPSFPPNVMTAAIAAANAARDAVR